MPTATTTRVGEEGTRAARVATGRSRQVAGEASEEAQNVAAAAAEKGGELVRSAKDDARQIAASVWSRGGEVTEQLSTQGRSLMQETRAQVQAQARTGTERTASTLRQFGEQAQALAEGRPEDAPQLSEYVWKVADSCYGAADRIYGLADDIEQRGLGGVLEDVQTFARRRPGTFLLGAVVLGFGVGRLVKANAEQESDDEEEEETPRRAAPARTRGVR
jgi:hypothetical protein